MKGQMNSPERIGAFFDLDGTLLQSPSLEWRFITWLAARDKIGSGEIGRWLGCFAKTFVTEAIRSNPGLGRGSGPLNHFA